MYSGENDQSNNGTAGLTTGATSLNSNFNSSGWAVATSGSKATATGSTDGLKLPWYVYAGAAVVAGFVLWKMKK